MSEVDHGGTEVAAQLRKPTPVLQGLRPELALEGEEAALGILLDPRRQLLAMRVTQPNATTLRSHAVRELSHHHGNQFVQRTLLSEGFFGQLAQIGRIDRQPGVERSTFAPTAAPEVAIQRDGSTTTVTINITEALGGTYNVTATTLAGAAAQMDARGEWGRGGARDLSYSGGTVNDDGIVSSVAISGVYFRTLPRWTRLASQSEAVQAEWNRMLGALTTHENRHVSIARTHIEELRAELGSIHEDDLASTWNAKVGPTGALQTAQNAYDTSTTSGQTQGVFLQEPAEEEEEGASEGEGVEVGGEE